MEFNENQIKTCVDAIQKPNKSIYHPIKKEKYKDLPENLFDIIKNYLGDNYNDFTKIIQFDTWETCNCKARKQIAFNASFSTDFNKAILVLICPYCNIKTIVYLEK
jgi:hypothetical protein